jgi:hypothetical protein
VATAYKVRSGFHSDGETTYRKGQVFKSDKPLHKMFPNKFDMVADSQVPKAKSSKAKIKKERYNSVKPLPELGKNVTQKFPDALNKGLVVFQNDDGEYSITDERDLYTPLNKKPLTRLRAKKFLVER